MKDLYPTTDEEVLRDQQVRLALRYPSYDEGAHQALLARYEDERARWQRRLELARHGACAFPNVRFWKNLKNDWVRLKLRPGQQITLCGANRDEEGRSKWEQTYTYDHEHPGGPCIVFHGWSLESGCDGSAEHDRYFICPIERLDARDSETGADYPWTIPVPRPEWRETSRRYAEGLPT